MIIVLFGATGSAGGGVLDACVADPGVTEVRAIVRRPLTRNSPKVHEFIHNDFADLSLLKAAFGGVDACFYCLGISTTQVSGEPEYRRITYDYAIAAARALKAAAPSATFHFISAEGAALDSRFMWARVKAETERDLLQIGGVLCYRPTYIDGSGSASEPKLYKLIRPALSRILRPFPQLYVAAATIGRAMLEAQRRGIKDEIIMNTRIRELGAA